MISKKAVALLFLLFGALTHTLIACGTPQGTEAALVNSQQPAPTEIPPTPTPALIEEIEAVVEPEVDECIECHTDQERLTQTADPEEDHESESSGEG